jgi:hypothetical protein
MVPVQSPQEIDEKNSKKDYLYRSENLIFGPKKFLKNFGAGTWYCLQNNFF